MLSDTQRRVLATLADELLPAFRTVPAASAVDVHGRWIDRALAARPDLEPALAKLLDGARDAEPAAELQRLRVEDAAAFDVFTMLVTWAYYAHPKVRARLRYPGQRAAPFAADDADHDLGGGLLEPVIARGPIYLATPSTDGRALI